MLIHVIIGSITDLNSKGVFFTAEQDFTAEQTAEQLLAYIRSVDPWFEGTEQAIQACLDRGCTALIQEKRVDGYHQFHLVQEDYIQGGSYEAHIPTTGTCLH